MFMQKLWQLKLDWDEALPMTYYTYWQEFRSKLNDLNQLVIPRFLFEDIVPNELVELHGFADASETAFGAAVYTRYAQVKGQFRMQLMCSKSRVAPLQKSTIPRLELCAAVLLAKLMTQVRAVVNFPVSNVIYWTDSTIVLHWLNTSPANLKTFVGNRVATIQELTKGQNWYHIESKQNPADIISRGMMPTALMGCKMWFEGPPILQSLPSPWLTTKRPPCLQPDHCEYKPATALIGLSLNEYTSIFVNMKYINNYTKLTRVMAYASQFFNNIRKKNTSRISGALTSKSSTTEWR